MDSSQRSDEDFEPHEAEWGWVWGEDYSTREVRAIDASDKSPTPKDIRRRIAQEYQCDPFQRKFHITPVVNHYGRIGCVLFSLHGSPPKGYALYIGGSVGRVVFSDVRGQPYEIWDGVKFGFDQ